MFYIWSKITLKDEKNIPVGTLEATLERKSITKAKTSIPLKVLICACGFMKSQKALGTPVLLNPSTVTNIPQKNSNNP